MTTSTLGNSSSHTVRLFPRRKMNDNVRESHGYNQRERQPHLFDASAIADYFCFVQSDAARQLGISVTTLKKVCRKVGIERWPGPRRRCYRETRSWNDAHVQSNSNPAPNSARHTSAHKSHGKNQQHRDRCRLSRFQSVIMYHQFHANSANVISLARRLNRCARKNSSVDSVAWQQPGSQLFWVGAGPARRDVFLSIRK